MLNICSTRQREVRNSGGSHQLFSSRSTRDYTLISRNWNTQCQSDHSDLFRADDLMLIWSHSHYLASYKFLYTVHTYRFYWQCGLRLCAGVSIELFCPCYPFITLIFCRGNVLRYGRYFVTVMLGTGYVMLRPIAGIWTETGSIWDDATDRHGWWSTGICAELSACYRQGNIIPGHVMTDPPLSHPCPDMSRCTTLVSM